LSIPDLEPLFQPFQLKNISLPTRFVMPPMNRGWTVDGMPSDKYGEYYAARVRGGVGLVITGACPVDHPSSSAMTDPLITRKSGVAWGKAAAAVRSAGGHLFQQLWHEGAIRVEGRGPYPDAPTLSPSGIAAPGRRNGRAATIEELEEIKGAYANAAVIAQQSGFSGVEIHGAHGFLLDQFLWAETNKRVDRYGGATVLERARFPLEIVAAVRAAVGPDYPISYRYSQWKEVAFEARIIDVRTELESFLAAFRKTGVDLFNCSSRYFWHPEVEGSNLTFAGWSKKYTDVPVVTVGSVGLKIDLFGGFMADQAEFEFAGAQQIQQLADLYRQGQFDLVAVGRSIIGDAQWLQKVRAGRFNEIRPFTKSDVMGDYEYDPGIVGETHGLTAVSMRN
jgi:2,4-dienoyl-CoA reductase-like NADH-dependent reductase (Old Yellow Enzyme family)